MAEERREGGEQDKGKGKATSRHTSPSSSSSQGDMADNEMEVGHTPTSEHMEGPPPPKKKRTRTLTTPHQAAVLHALLAQSRFPTTAMREEVGRAIGLSARKVQIWFQNQRQKARRPRGQNVPPLTRPPQYGPFPSAASSTSHGEISMAPDASAAGSSQLAHLRGGSFSSPRSAGLDPAWRELHSSEGYHRTPGITSQLSGPGIPGPHTGPSSPESLLSAAHAPHEAIRPRTSHTSANAPRRQTTTRPWTSERREQPYTVPQLPSSVHRHSTDFALRLPPLRLSRPRSRTFAEHSASHMTPISAYAEASSPQAHLPPIQSDSPFIYEAPSRLPPPFTLQPQPQWDDPSFSPYSRPAPHTSIRHPTAPYEAVVLPPPSAHEASLTLAPARFPTVIPTPSAPSPHSLPGPSSPLRLRHPDDDKPSVHDAPR
ncbi:hypothetical protein BC835DRAFT_1365034 [Cytidiella melzeri]|nr:hypothetical protein BC835DRAFT_1365034 [Cytidiella melzeri]